MREFIIEKDPKTGKQTVEIPFIGVDLLRDPIYNKDTGFTMEERGKFDLLGLVPPYVSTMSDQIKRAYGNYKRKETDLERYIYLLSLHARNQTLFYRLLIENYDEMNPIVYTPTVGLACQLYSHIYRSPRGLYITEDDADRIEEVLMNAPFSNVAVIVVTDNERILGLGDLGAGGMGIPIGKLALYTGAAGTHPAKCIPIDLDVGTNNEELLNDPLYLGVRKKRLRGDAYYALIDKFVKGVKKVFPNAILQWEDFKKENAFTLLDRYKDFLPSFNDDIQGTAAVVLAGVMSAMRIKGEKLRDQRFMLYGAGASGIGISYQIKRALIRDGLSEKEAVERIFLSDSQGLLVSDRQNLEAYKKPFAHPSNAISQLGLPADGMATLVALVAAIKPTVLIGVSGIPKTFTPEVLEAVAKHTKNPVVFPLSNPTANSECTPDEIYRSTDGRAIVATGSPFQPVQFKGKTYPVAQCNNMWVFPGLGLGAGAIKAKTIPEDLFIAAADAVANEVSSERLAQGCVFPEVKNIRDVERKVAIAVAREAVKLGLAPKRNDDEIVHIVDSAIWFPDYAEYRYKGK